MSNGFFPPGRGHEEVFTAAAPRGPQLNERDSGRVLYRMLKRRPGDPSVFRWTPLAFIKRLILGAWDFGPFTDKGRYSKLSSMASDDAGPVTKADLKADLKVGLDELESKLNKKIDSVSVELENKLNKKIDGVAVELIKTQADVRQIKETMSTKADIDRVMNAIDAFARKAEAYDRKALSHGDQLQGHEAKIQDHEKRLSAVESKS